MKKIFAIAVAVMLFGAAMPEMALCGDITNVSSVVSVSESSVIRPSDKGIIGLHDGSNFEVGNDSSVINPYYYNAFKQYGIEAPLIRAHFRTSNWKDYVGSSADRGYGVYSEKYNMGIVEWIKTYQKITPDAAFVLVIDHEDTPENLQDLVRFLTLEPGDSQACSADGTNWPQKRIELGLRKPVNVECFEIDNEVDMKYTKDNDTVLAGATYYSTRVAAISDAIKTVNPKAKTSALAYTTPHDATGYKDIWNEYVIRTVGAKVDYIILHYYYHSGGNQGYAYDREYVENDIMHYINLLPEGSRPKIYMSEHAVYANPSVAATADKAMITGLAGTLTTAEIINRTSNNDKVAIATYHAVLGSLSTDEIWGGSCWGMLRPYTNCKLVMACVGEYFKMAYDAFGENIVNVTCTGDHEYCTSGTMWNNTGVKILTASAHTTANGGLNLILVNTNPSVSHTITLNAEHQYKLRKTAVLTGENALDENYSATPNAIYTKETLVNDSNEFTSYTVLPRSVTVLYFDPMSAPQTENSSLEVRIENQSGSVNNLPIVKDKKIRLDCTVFDNGELKKTNSLACMILKGSADVGNLSSDDIVAVAEQKVERQRAFFEIGMPANTASGEYIAYVANNTDAPGSGFAKHFDYSLQEQPELEVLTPQSQNSDYELSFFTVTADKIPTDTPVNITVTSDSTGETAYVGTVAKTENAQQIKVKMPREAVSGKYTICLDCEYGASAASAQADFDFVKPGESVRIAAAPKTSDDSVYSFADAANNADMNVKVKNISEAERKMHIIAAVYDKIGKLLSVCPGESDTAAPNTEITLKTQTGISGGTAVIGAVKVFLWEDLSVSPLTDCYIIKE